MKTEALAATTAQDAPLMPLVATRLGVHAGHEAVVFIRADSPVCRAEGLGAQTRVVLRSGAHEIIATLYQVSHNALSVDQAGLSESAWAQLSVAEGDSVTVRHANPLESFTALRSRMVGDRLDESAMRFIISDIAAGRYSDMHIAAFLTACTAAPLSEQENVYLTRAMVDTGVRLSWGGSQVLDKHCVGGLPGNRTTPIVVAIVAAHGLMIPKTSSRAITSPAGTADTMETLAPVDLSLSEIRRVVERESGCIVWGGAVQLSPADDVLIRVQRALDLDNEGQLVASVLSKKISAGATHLVIDIPVGPTAKVRSASPAKELDRRLQAVAAAFGLNIAVIHTDGLQPVGRGIGPSLEARDLLAVLQRQDWAPLDLSERACCLAGALLEIGGKAAPGQGAELARNTLNDGRAWTKFQRICEAQGGLRSPPVAALTKVLVASETGEVCRIDNRRLAKLAKLAGAPDRKAAGVDLHCRLGDRVMRGQPLCTVHADSQGELQYALDYAQANLSIIEISPQ